jgi:hypothetical protein
MIVRARNGADTLRVRIAENGMIPRIAFYNLDITALVTGASMNAD